MKAVILSVIILCLAVTLVSANAIWSITKLNSVLTEIKSAESAEDIRDFIGNWNRIKEILSLTNKRGVLTEIDRALENIYIAYNNNEDFATDEAKNFAISLIERLLASQKFDWKSII